MAENLSLISEMEDLTYTPLELNPKTIDSHSILEVIRHKIESFRDGLNKYQSNSFRCLNLIKEQEKKLEKICAEIDQIEARRYQGVVQEERKDKTVQAMQVIYQNMLKVLKDFQEDEKIEETM